ncbi:MAG: AAA family ATPase [Patescibacteria group bacterium]
MIIIGITGTIGAGKGTVVEYLSKKKDFMHYSAREFLTTEVKRRGLPVDRDSFTTVANSLRHENGPFFIALSLYETAAAEGKNAIIESLRTPGEVSFLRDKDNFFLLAVDANIELRYERIVKRNLSTDHVTLERFKSDEQREMSSSDPSSQNLRACIDMADGIVYNQGSLEELYEAVDKALASFFGEEHI